MSESSEAAVRMAARVLNECTINQLDKAAAIIDAGMAELRAKYERASLIADSIAGLRKSYDELRAENERLREGLRSIVARGEGTGISAAMCVTVTTLATIAKEVLASESNTGNGK